MALIREIKKEDNVQLAKVIREVLISFNVPKVGTAYADAALDCMFETYDVPKATYYVVEDDGKIIGGAGIAQLANSEENICELQKMYFSDAARGKGLGAKMMETCLNQARKYKFDKCYLETMPNMDHAQHLYKKTGFTYIDAPMGCTGHNSCPVWMLKDLS